MNASGRTWGRGHSKRVLFLLFPYFGQLAVILLVAILSIPLCLLLPVPLKIVVDAMSRPQVIDGVRVPVIFAAVPLISMSVVLSVLLGLWTIRSIASGVLHRYTSGRLVHALRGQMLWEVQRTTLASHGKVGHFASRIHDDAPAISDFVLHGLVPLVASFALWTALVTGIFVLYPELGWLSLLASPVLYILNRHSGALGHPPAPTAPRSTSSGSSFRASRQQQSVFRRRSRFNLAEQLRISSRHAGRGALLAACLGLVSILALSRGIDAVQHHTLTLGGLFLALGYFAELFLPVRSFAAALSEISISSTSLLRALSLFDAPSVPERLTKSVPNCRVSGRVEFRNVYFRYAPGAPEALKNISFEILPGTRVGLLGPEGSGRSTLVNLITGAFEPSEGHVLLDGIDLREYSVDDLRSQFAIVLQEPLLFRSTVAANIAYDNPDASREQVIAAAKLVKLHDFVITLPSGYDTPMDEDGAPLNSRAQTLLSAARALLKDSPLVVIDEPCRAAEMQEDLDLLEAMDRVADGRTTFVVANRLSTLENCDIALVLRDGKLTVISNGKPDPESMTSSSVAGKLSTSIGPGSGPMLVR